MRDEFTDTAANNSAETEIEEEGETSESEGSFSSLRGPLEEEHSHSAPYGHDNNIVTSCSNGLLLSEKYRIPNIEEKEEEEEEATVDNDHVADDDDDGSDSDNDDNGSNHHNESHADFSAALRAFFQADKRVQTKSQLGTGQVKSAGSRRIGLKGKACEYGMDRVGEHVASIQEWIELVHKSAPKKSQRSLHFQSWTRRHRPRWRDMGSYGKRHHDDDEKGTSHGGTAHHEEASPPALAVKDDKFPQGVAVHIGLEDALRGLSSCLYAAYTMQDELEEYAGEVRRIVEIVARIPSLMKTILLIEDEDDRKYVMEFPVIRRVMLCKYSVMTRKAAFQAARFGSIVKSSDSDDNYATKSSLLKRRSMVGLIENRRKRKEGQDMAIKRECDNDAAMSNSWLLEMLNTGNKKLRSRAVDYLEILSTLTVNDYLSVALDPSIDSAIPPKGPTPTPEDIRAFDKEQRELFATFCNFTRLIPFLFALNTSEIERAAVTPIISSVLDEAITRPFSVAVIFADLLFNCLLIFGWRIVVLQLMYVVEGDIEKFQEEANSFVHRLMTLLGLLSFAYFTFRMIGDIIASLRISFQVFYVNFIDFWNLVELCSLITVFISLLAVWNVEVKTMQVTSTKFFVFAGFSVGLLWLKFVGFLKVINRKLATFVLAIVQIMYDIALFLLIMLIMVLAFGDMLFVILSANFDACPENYRWDDYISSLFNMTLSNSSLSGEGDGDESPFCVSRGQSYLSVYGILVGDVNMDYYTVTPVTVVLFVLLTFLGVIILLNVLIALVDESYERSTMKSARLFGRARVVLVAKISALEELLHPYDSSNKRKKRLWSSQFDRVTHYFMRILSVALATILGFGIVFTMNILYEELQNKTQLSSRASRGIAMGCLAPLWLQLAILVSFLFSGWKKMGKGRKWIRWFQNNRVFIYSVAVPVTFITLRALGTTRTKSKSKTHNEDDWNGRLNHIGQQVHDAVDESEQHTKEAIGVLERRIEELEAARSKEMKELMKEMGEKERISQTLIEELEFKRNTEVKQLMEVMEKREEKAKADLQAMENRLTEAILRATPALVPGND